MRVRNGLDFSTLIRQASKSAQYIQLQNLDTHISGNPDTHISGISDTNTSGNPYKNISRNPDTNESGNMDIDLKDYKSFFSYECTINSLIDFFDMILYEKKKLNNFNSLNIPYIYKIYGDTVEEIRLNKYNIDCISHNEIKIENIIEKYFF
jgi:hypothetical protein